MPRVVVTGATGMVGGAVLRLCLEHPKVSAVTAIGRRTTQIMDPKLEEIEHASFSDFSGVDLSDHQLAFHCLGAYTGTVSDEDFRKITLDYTVAFAKALQRENPNAVFCLLSGQGADQSEKSSMSFARYKGAAEKALFAMGFSRVHSFRPGYIHPATPRREPNTMYSIMRGLYPVLRRVYPNIGVPSDVLARVMLDVGLHGAPDHGPVLENRDIRALAQRPAHDPVTGPGS